MWFSHVSVVTWPSMTEHPQINFPVNHTFHEQQQLLLLWFLATSTYRSLSIDLKNWIISLGESMMSLLFEARMTLECLFECWYCPECVREWKMEWKQAIFLCICDASSLQHRNAARLCVSRREPPEDVKHKTEDLPTIPAHLTSRWME